MRRYMAAIAPLCTIAASIASGATAFPYKAYVTADDVYVRSGPGSSYYPTGKLREGQEVEIYRHDPGGWYAIRPPEGSYTWVSGRYLGPIRDGITQIAGDRVAARVGSQFSDIRDVIQVRLHRGEAVEVLGEKASGTGASKQMWYKIAPPSGEFRWVFGKYVDPNYPCDGVRKAPAGSSPFAGRGPAKVDVPATGRAEAATAQAPKSSPPVASTVRTPSATVAEPYSAPVRIDPPVQPVMSGQLSPEEFDKEVGDVDMELSIMVAEEPTVWVFDELLMDARALLIQAQTAVERGRARVLINKIQRFQDIKERYDSVNTMWADTEKRNHQLASAPSGRRGTGEQRPGSDDRFDGTGELSRVVSPKAGAPRYALVDEQGDVRCYVTPAPGVNLRHYLGRQVGVNGTRGYMPKQSARHVMAKHISMLDNEKLR